MRRAFWGVLVVILGVMGFLQGLGIAHFGLALGPLVLFLFGAWLFSRGLFPEGFGWRMRRSWIKMGLGLWIACIGLFDMLHSAGVTDASGDDVLRLGWPLLFVGLGLSLIFGVSISRSSNKLMIRKGMVGDIHFGKEPWVLDGPLHINQNVGDIRVDLTTATIEPGTHDIAVAGTIGEIHIRVPSHQNIHVTAATKVGDINVLNDHRHGVNVSLAKKVNHPEATATLNIDVRLRIGSIRVVQFDTHSQTAG